MKTKTPWDTIYYGHNLFSATNTEKAANTYLWSYYLQMVSDYLNKGGKFIRTIQLPWGSLLEFEEKGNYYKRLHYAYEQDKLLDTLEKYDALMVFNMMYQTPVFRYDVFDGWMWDWEDDIYDANGQLETWGTDFPRYCYNDKPPHQKLPYEMFTNESDLSYHKQRVRYYVARYGYSTHIYEFELLSEPFHIGEQKEIKNAAGVTTVAGRFPYKDPSDPEYTLARNAILNYHTVLAGYIKDSLQWHNQLIGVNMGYFDKDPFEPYDFRNSSLPNIDIAGFNAYYANIDAVYNIEDFVQKIWNDRGISMPVLISEGGTTPNYEECSNYSQQPVDMMSLGFTKLAGFHPWTGYSPDFDWDYTHFWKHTIRAQYHMNGDDVINTLSEGGGDWGYGKEEEKLFLIINNNQSNEYAIENQYYISNNKEEVVGYIRNRTYNVHTTRINDNCDLNYGNKEPIDELEDITWNDVRLFPISRRLKVENLKYNASYRIDYYSFKTGNYLSTQCDNTTANRNYIVLEYPELKTKDSSNENPVIWYVIQHNGCSQGMILNDSGRDTLQSIIDVVGDYNAENVNIFPNPFDNYFDVISKSSDILTVLTIEGKIIKRVTIDKGLTRIATSEFPGGVYLLRLENQGYQFKMIKL